MGTNSKPTKPHAVIRDGSVSVLIYRETRANGAFRYRVAWGSPRQRKGFTEEGPAKAFARERARSLSEHGSATLTLSGEESLAYRQILAAAEAYGLSLESAFSEWSAAREKLAGQPPLSEAVADHLSRREPQ